MPCCLVQENARFLALLRAMKREEPPEFPLVGVEACPALPALQAVLVPGPRPGALLLDTFSAENHEQGVQWNSPARPVATWLRPCLRP